MRKQIHNDNKKEYYKPMINPLLFHGVWNIYSAVDDSYTRADCIASEMHVMIKVVECLIKTFP